MLCWRRRTPPAKRWRRRSRESAAIPGGSTRPDAENIAGYLELHIEQGVVLENKGVDLGLVTAIVGIARVEIVFEGAADHAGTTPMDLRRDAGLGAARLILEVAAEAHEFAARGRGHFVATTGTLEQQPNAANVVPGRSRMVFDIRAEDDDLLQEFLADLDVRSRAAAAAAKVGAPVSNCCRARTPRIATKVCWACCNKAPRATG